MNNTRKIKSNPRPTGSRFSSKGLKEQLRLLLLMRGHLGATEICTNLGISQSSFSRLAASMQPGLLKTGKARKTHYALKRTIPLVGDCMPLYAVNESGHEEWLADLYPIEPKGFYLNPKKEGVSEAFFPDIPYFLDDLRPSGYLGRLIPKTHPDLEAPPSVANWSSDDCLRYWVKYGWNLVGNLILGKPALELFLKKKTQNALHPSESSNTKQTQSYPTLAQAVQLHGDPGSSAGGEQAKFLVNDSEQNGPALLIKFSPPLPLDHPQGGGNQPNQRIADLLVCESIEHKTLSRHGFPAAESQIIQVEKQIFLEVRRFDRVGKFGRKGIISLKALSLEFVGTLDSWSAIATGLFQEKLISLETCEHIQLLDLFGECIGNSDRHAGNLSFFFNGNLKPAGLTPIYDMLPMLYAPQNYQILDRIFEPKLPTPEHRALWNKASEMAIEFWLEVSKHPLISKPFQEIATENSQKLRALRFL